MKTMSKMALVAAAVAGTILSGTSHANQVFYRHDGELRDGWRQDLRIYMQRGLSYRFYGECDLDCDDLDFELFDQNGRLLDSDKKRDDVPIVEKWSGPSAYYTLRVSMANCDVNPCTYGVMGVAW